MYSNSPFKHSFLFIFERCCYITMDFIRAASKNSVCITKKIWHIKYAMIFIHSYMRPIHSYMHPSTLTCTHPLLHVPIHSYMQPIHSYMLPIHSYMQPIHSYMQPIHSYMQPFHFTCNPSTLTCTHPLLHAYPSTLI